MHARRRLTIRFVDHARPNRLARLAFLAAVLAAAAEMRAQSPAVPQLATQDQAARASAAQPPALAPQADPPQPVDPPGSGIPSRPIAIVPMDANIPGAAAEVTGGLQVYNGRAFIANSASITAGGQTTDVVLPYRGTLHVCAGSTVKLTTDANVPAGEIAGLLMGLETGAVEASFATGRDSDLLITPDFRIIIGGPGAAEVKVRLGPGGDTCVDNAGVNAPYVVVSSVFEGGAYRVQAGQRVMFQKGSLHEVVDAEKEPCGCPPAGNLGNEFPLAQSEGLAPTLHPTPVPPNQVGNEAEGSGALVYNGAERARRAAAPAAEQPAPAEAAPAAPPATPPAAAPATPTATPPAATPPVAPATQPTTPQPPAKKPSVIRRIGRFFKRVFGAE